jgi:hypothetical protein
MIEVKQDLLKFTNVWLEYDHLDRGFIMPTGYSALWASLLTNVWSGGSYLFSQAVPADTAIWRIAFRQDWTDKWATALYYANHSWNLAGDPTASQFNIGVRYQYTPQVAFGISYSIFSYDDAAKTLGANDSKAVRFRTDIMF